MTAVKQLDDESTAVCRTFVDGLLDGRRVLGRAVALGAHCLHVTGLSLCERRRHHHGRQSRNQNLHLCSPGPIHHPGILH